MLFTSPNSRANAASVRRGPLYLCPTDCGGLLLFLVHIAPSEEETCTTRERGNSKGKRSHVTQLTTRANLLKEGMKGRKAVVHCRSLNAGEESEIRSLMRRFRTPRNSKVTISDRRARRPLGQISTKFMKRV